MFGGMKGNSLISNIAAHYYFYMKNSFKQIIKRASSLDDVKSLISLSNADIICINEVIYDLQKEELTAFLDMFGYKTIIINKSSNRKNYFNLCTILASKFQGNKIEFDITKDNYITREGSICALEIPSKNILTLGVHLSLSKERRMKQLKEISEFIESKKDQKKDIFIMGDFNETILKLQKYAEFKKMNLISCRVPTYPAIPIFEWLKRDYDHIFHTSNHKVDKIETKKGSSDHFLLKFELSPMN